MRRKQDRCVFNERRDSMINVLDCRYAEQRLQAIPRPPNVYWKIDFMDKEPPCPKCKVFVDAVKANAE